MFAQIYVQPQVVAALSQVSTLVGSARASSVTTPRRNIHNLQKSKQHSEIRNEFQELFDLLDVKQLPENLSATELSPLNAHTTQRKRFKDYKEKNSSSATFFENKNGFSENLLNHQGHVMVSGILSNGHFQNFLRQTISSLARQPSRGFKTKRGLQYTGIHKKEPEEETTSRGAFYQNILKKREILSGDKTDIDDIMKNVKTKKSKNDNLLGEIAGNPELQKFLNAAVLQGYKTGRSDKLGTSEKNSNQEYYSKFMRRVLLVSLIVGLYCFTVYVTGLPGILRMKKNFEIMPENVNVTFDDVKGVDEVKDELANIVGYLRDPEKFTCLGARLPKGVLMVGPPGVGKTLLARAIAGEANVPFFYAAGSEFDEVFVGQGAKRVRQLFSAAKMRSPCIIFIDEIDSVGASRTSSEIHPYANQTINQLLGEMDGFNQNEGVIVVGATNRKDVLDKAILRPGRFDVEVTITLPDMKGRIDILKHYLTRVKCSKDVDIEKLGKGTFGMSGAELENIVNQAALKAATDNQLLVHMEHFEYARDKILMGPEKKSRTPDEETNWVTACHEAGHTIVAFFTKDASPIHKVTIIRRGQALGHTSFLPQKDQFNFTKSQLYARMDVAMGGRVAEELVFGLDKVTTGASGDFTDATAVAHQIVESFGMSEKIGVGRYTGRTVSPETQKLIDDEVHKILQESYERAKVILKAHINEHKNLSQALMKYETLDKSEVESLIAGKKLKK